MFQIALFAVLNLLLFAIPGFLLVKSKMIKQDSISAFAKLLMYVCQPSLMIYSFLQVEKSAPLVKNMLIFFAITLVLQAVVILFFFFCVRKKKEDVRYRICAVASAFGNCAFLGVPLLEKMLPNYPEAIVFSNMFAISMNLLGWTLSSYIISLDRKYISVKKLVLNPAVLSCFVGIPLFACGVTIGKLPTFLSDFVTLLARMCTSLCMLIMGMRLATIPIKELFNKPYIYGMVFVKQILYPLLGLLVVYFLPLEDNMKITLFILCSAPIAAVVQNYAEIIGKGQDTAANLVLFGTFSSVLTIPLMSLIVTALFGV